MSNNFKADYDRMRTTKPEYETMRIMLKDGSLIKPELIQRSDLFSGNVELFNARLQYDQDSLEQLRDSIIAIGVQDDLRGFYTLDKDGDKVLVITDGHRRLFACAWARETGHAVAKLPCKPDKLDKSMGREYYLLTQLRTNNGTQVPYTMLEQGLLVKQFLAYGHDIEEIVLQTGLKKAHLENCLSLANTSGGVKEMIKQGTVAPTTVIQSINTDKSEYRDVLDEALDIAEKEAVANGKDKVKVTGTHVKKAREKRLNVEASDEQKAKLLEDVQNADFGALSYSDLQKIESIIKKHWKR